MYIGKNIHLISGWWNEIEGNKNLFLFSHLIKEDNITLIDTGSSIFPDGAIFPYMKSVDLNPKDISLILNTHGHIDHMGGNARVQEISGAKIATHELEVPNIEDHELSFKNRTVSPERKKQSLYLMGESTGVDIVLHDGDYIDIGGERRLKVVLTPGHSPGSISFYDEEEKVLFSGDAVFLGETVVKMPAYTDVDAYIGSIRRIGELELKFLLPSHYPPLRGSNVPSALKRCLRLVKDIDETLLTILEKLSTPSKTSDIALAVCSQLDYPPSPSTIEAHLIKLVNESKVEQIIKNNDRFWKLK